MARRARPRRWRGVAGMAAAASVAGVVFLAGNPFVRSNTSGSEGRVAAASNAPSTTRARSADQTERQGFGSGGWNDQLADFSSVHAQPARFQTVAARGAASSMSVRTSAAGMTASQGPADHWSVSDPAVRDELNGYLADHNGMARGYGMPSATPALVHVAAYGQDVTQ